LITRRLVDIDTIDLDNRTPLHGAVKRDTLVVKTLLKFGCRTDILDRLGYTPLKETLRCRGVDRKMILDQVELLLAYGVDLQKEPYLYDEEEQLEMSVLRDRISISRRDIDGLDGDLLLALRNLRKSNEMNSLQRTCRKVIRRHLGSYADEKINSFNCIPSKLKSFLLVKEEKRVLNWLLDEV